MKSSAVMRTRVSPAIVVALLIALWPSLGRAQTGLQVRVYASGFTAPIAFVQDPTDRAVQFVVEQSGRVRVVRDGIVQPTDFLDLRSVVLSGGERGLLGLALSPDYVSSGRFFVNFTDASGNTVVARFRRSSNRLVADAGSRFDLRWGGPSGPTFIVQPFANHNGGHLAFGPDGFLYVGLGDGGSGGDPGNRAQNPTELLGKMLRIDVNVPDSDPVGYQVPPSNPFVAGGPPGARPEIWSIGLRNPWRYNFDDPSRGGNGALLIADVGQDSWEEVDYEPPARGGRNYGWRNREGAHDYDQSVPPATLPLIEPIHEYSHSVGQSITGGYVYRGRALGAAYRGRYFFADFVQRRIWSLALAIDPATGEAHAFDVVEHTNALGGGAAIGNISSFGVDLAAELYVVSYSLGAILKIVPSLPVSAADGDFDGDRISDITVYRPATGTWFIRQSATLTPSVIGWGGSSDVPVPGDYDGDGKTDVAVFRRATGEWFIRQSGTLTLLTVVWGGGSDVPVPGDYDGDGKIDVAVFRPSTGMWFIRQSSTLTMATVTWGGGFDIPVPGDYDADARTDVAVFRPSTGEWFIRRSSTLSLATLLWGGGADTPVQADFDGDGKTDVAVFRPSTGTWYLRLSSTLITATIVWGAGADVPVRGDYDRDGVTDIAIFRPSTGEWFIRRSSTQSLVTFVWGGAADIPLLKFP